MPPAKKRRKDHCPDHPEVELVKTAHAPHGKWWCWKGEHYVKADTKAKPYSPARVITEEE